MTSLPANAADPISRAIWDLKYRLKSDGGAPLEQSVEATWQRVAQALAAVEAPARRAHWEEAFLKVMEDHRFLPAGRILAGAGTGRRVTLFNCFVMGAIPDSMDGIFEGLQGSRPHHAAGRRHRPRFLHPQAQGRPGPGRRRRCLRSLELHGCLGFHVPHHHVGRRRAAAP